MSRFLVVGRGGGGYESLASEDGVMLSGEKPDRRFDWSRQKRVRRDRGGQLRPGGAGAQALSLSLSEAPQPLSWNQSPVLSHPIALSRGQDRAAVLTSR